MFKPGDRVLCIRSSKYNTKLMAGKHFTVVGVRDDARLLTVEGVSGKWAFSRFELARDLSPFEQSVRAYIEEELR